MTTDSNSPRVTVVVPCFDQAHFLKDSLASVRAQTLERWRAIVVDDGSAAAEEVRRALDRFDDERIELIAHDSNRGRASARNSGIRASESEFVLMLDANDRLVPDCLQRLVAALDEDETLDCAFPDVGSFGRPGGLRIHAAPDGETPLLDEAGVPPGSGTLMRRSFLERVGLFDEAPELKPAKDDFEFWVRAAQSACKAQRVAAALYERRITHMSFYGSPNDDRVADYVLNKHRGVFAQAGTEGKFRGRWYARSARSAYARGDRGRAVELATRARRADPGSIGRQEALRFRLPFSTNRALDGGSLRRAVPLLGYPLHGPIKRRPFFIIGLGHSGNGLLRQVLNAHSELHMPPPAWVLGSCIRKFKQHRRHLTWPDLVQVILADFEYHPEFRHFDMSLAPVVQRLSYAPKPQRDLASLINAVFHYHAETHGHSCTRWGDDAPLNSLDDAVAGGDQPKQVGKGVPQTLERLLEVFPDAQFVHLYRDGCEVVSNYLRDGVFDEVRDGALRWLNVELQTSRFVAQHPASCHDVRCEDLLAKPEETVRALCTFLGIEFEAAMLGTQPDSPWSWDEEAAELSHAQAAGGARQLFSTEQRQSLQGLLGEALSERAYPPATA